MSYSRSSRKVVRNCAENCRVAGVAKFCAIYLTGLGCFRRPKR